MLNYGIIGNCKTCALIDDKASINWMCFPEFDSQSVFAKILDENIGGTFGIEPRGDYTITQAYSEHTNILETTFKSKRAAFVVIDFFPRYRKLLPNKKTKLLRHNSLVRLIKPIKGKPIIKVNYQPKPGYAKKEPKHRVSKGILHTKAGKESISLVSNVDYDILTEELHFKLDHTKYFVIGSPTEASYYNATKLKRLASATKQYWKTWVRSLELPEENKALIIRSALTLKLLTHSETGAVIAAATTSLPEEVGSERNWDYRFCWVRDASLTVDALKKIGRDHEAKKLMSFLFEHSANKKQPLRLMYGIHGETDLKEKILGHLDGYMGSKPVRIGNGAYNQQQNDIYGSLIDLLYLYYVYYEYEKKMTRKFWNFLLVLVKDIKDNWKKKDQGIWEFRGSKQHFTYSKLMCYVGIDRAVKIAQHYDRMKHAEEWAVLRDEIRQDMLTGSWNEKKHAFTMSYGTEELDASTLQLVYHEVLQNDDPRLISTVHAINKELRQGPFVQRYKAQDDFGKSHNAFSICSFWLVDALYHIGEEQQARKLFKELASYANPLGLYAEDFDVKNKTIIGNFPQAYTHIALINSAILLSDWASKRKKLQSNGKKKIQ